MKLFALRTSEPRMRYEKIYTWLVLTAALDIMLTWIVLHRGGEEVNIIADLVITQFGLTGMVLFKFALVLLIIVIAEEVGRRSIAKGRTFAITAVAITWIPVVLAAVQLLQHPHPVEHPGPEVVDERVIAVPAAFH